MSEVRYEINHAGEIVAGKSALCSDLQKLLTELLCQFGWKCDVLGKDKSCYHLYLTHPGHEPISLNVYLGRIRDESRNPYEKKIQLGEVDPRKENKKDTIILGVYVYDANDSYRDAIFVGYSIDDNTQYPTNPSLRATVINKNLIQAKTMGIVFDEINNTVSFRAEFIYYYIVNHYAIHYKNKILPELDQDEVNGEGTEQNDQDFAAGSNILLYGVPGCGKSHKIKTEYCDDENYMERIVFHPDYTNSDFVGQIKPEIQGDDVKYTFVPGPFTRILKKAQDKEHQYYLVIEEINRGNAPAIFGEVFQLLDRIDGESEYGISNPDIAEVVYGDRNHLVKIPSNLTILATMNTADQNVFTLDTAFKRRWKMQRIENTFDNCDFRSVKVSNTLGITWEIFATTVNEYIEKNSINNIGGEDKRLGAFFVNVHELHDTEAFCEKVIMYLWNDAFKYNHDVIFLSEFSSLDDVLDCIYTQGFTKVFTPEFIRDINSRISETEPFEEA